MSNFYERNKGMGKKVGQLVNHVVDGWLLKAKRTLDYTNYMTLKRKAVYVNDSFITNQGIFQEKASIIPFDILRQVAQRDMAALAVINKVVNRVAAFSRPQKDRFSMGYVFAPRDKKEKLTEKQDKEIKGLYDFFTYTGYTDGRDKADIRNFDVFLRLLTWDSLVYNQIAIECVAQKGDDSKLGYFTNVPGGSIRYSVKDLKNKIKTLGGMIFNLDNSPERQLVVDDMEKEDLADIKYVQVYSGQVLAVFTEEELIYKSRRPSLEIGCQGYPVGELEFLVNTIANHRVAEIHNEVYFKQGHSSNGILNIKEEMTEEDLQGLRVLLQRQASGVRNAHRQLVTAAPKGIEYVQMSNLSNRDMEWHEWMMYLIKMICAVFGMNPAEINFDISKDTTGSLGDSGRRNEIVLKDTRNSMLRPLLNWIEDIINDDIMPKHDKDLAEKYIFEFVGLDAMDEDQELDRIKKKITAIYTINEVRRELGMEDLEGGNIILDSIFLQGKQQDQMGEEGDVGGDLFGGGDPEDEETGLGGEEEMATEEEKVSDEGVDLGDVFGEDKDKAKKSLEKAKKMEMKKAKAIRVEWWR